MNKNTIQIFPFTDNKEKWCMWLGKLMEGSGIKGYHVLLTCCKKTLVDYADETEEK